MRASPLPVDEAPPTGGTVAVQAAPLISGAPEILTAGAVAFIVILVLVLVLLGRWRAGRRAHDSLRNTEFFQPAGEGAEITFDDTQPAAQPVVASEPAIADVFAEPPAKKRRSPFGGLFSWREKAPAEPAFAEPEIVDPGDPDQGLASVRIERTAPPDSFAERRVVDFATIAREADRASAEREEAARAEEAETRNAEAARAAADEFRRRAAEADAERLRLAAEEEARRRASDGDRLRVPARPAHAFEAEKPAAQDDIARTLAEVEEALHAQREAIQSETRSLLDSFARRFSDRLDALAQSMDRREPARFDAANISQTRGDDVARLADEVARRLDDHHARLLAAVSKPLDTANAASREFAALREEIAALRRSLGDRAEPSAPTVQLTDLVRDALPPNAYEFNAVVANNRRADCLIRLPHPPGPIAIDARFPVEAFHALHQARPNAENEFRRTALRHVVDIAERLIAPGVTADSAMMFVPSESMYAELHARFPEVVQDSYRAHVWMVSPTTLMATLHTLSAVLKDAAPRGTAFASQSDAQRALAEVELLWARVAALEKGANLARSEMADAETPTEERDPNKSHAEAGAHAAERAFRRLQTAANQDSARAHGDLYADDRLTQADEADVDDAERRRPARPPFPLR